MRITKAFIEKIKKSPAQTAAELTDDELTKLLKRFADAYYNTGNSLIEDKIYDILFDILKERDPDNPFFKEVGASVKVNKQKVKLEYPMGSLDKVKPNTGALEIWIKKFKGPYVLSDKLDGVSAQIYNDNGNLKMFTRGKGNDEGNIGEDISHLLKYINIGKIENLPKNASIRGELIIKRSDFDKIKKDYKNIRNTVSGIVNSKKLDEDFSKIAKLVNFISYAILNPELSQQQQMIQLEKWKINVVDYKIVKKLEQNDLEEYLKDRRKTSSYDVDGIVCMDSSKVHKLVPGYPPYGFAFKMVLDDQFTTATIKQIIWEPSMDSYLKPVVEIIPVELGGTTITYATANNAKMVWDNKLGKGAQIKIIRSGDVIPTIMEVIKPAKNPDMPDIPYVWNETEVDIIIDYDEDIDDDILNKVKTKILTHFFRIIGVRYLSEGIIAKLVDNNYDTAGKILGAQPEDLYDIEGLGEKSINKIFKEIESKMKTVQLHTFMAATHLFGRGFAERKLKEILKVYPNILYETWTKKELFTRINNINGFSDIMANKFIENVDDFKQFCNELQHIYDITHIIKKKELKEVKKVKKVKTDSETESETETETESETEITTNSELLDKTIVFTGTRDKTLEIFIENSGGKVSTSVSKKTSIVVHSDNPDSSNAKYVKAKELNVKLMSISEFKKKYQK